MMKTKRLYKKMLLTQHLPLLQWKSTMLSHIEKKKKKVWFLLLILKNMQGSCSVTL